MTTKPTLSKLAITFLFAITLQTIIAQDLQDNQKALALVKKNAAAIGLSNDDIANSRISSAYEDALSGTTLVYLQQTYKGIDVDKNIQVLAFKNGTLVSFIGTRIDLSRSTVAASSALQNKVATPAITAERAIQSAAQHLHLPVPLINWRPAAGEDFSKPINFGDLGIAKEKVTACLIWVPQNTLERIKLAWEVNVSPKGTPDSWRVIVDAKGGSVIKKENYTVPDNWDKGIKQPMSGNRMKDYSSATPNPFEKESLQDINSVTYRVVSFPAEAPSFPNGAPSLVKNPWELSPAGSGATPFIWNEDSSKQYRVTRGNNVLAQEDINADNSGGKRAFAKNRNNLSFDYMPDFSRSPTDSINQGFAITNLFYWNNIMHDLSYQYGFDENSGNFQQDNLGRGGKGLDLVLADAQDGGGLNNANFNTPPDGQSPRMQMYLFNYSDPLLDGDLDNGVICHEYTHGISNRLTGGPSNTVCLFNLEGGGMGEGWSDYIALMTVTDWSKAEPNDGYKDKGIGTYVLNEPPDGPGIRTYPYSVDMGIDPHTYADLAKSSEVHSTGEVWASVLWDMTWFIIQRDGVNQDIFNANGEGGNTVAYKLVMTGMKLQPCNPGFIDGRDAILKADTLLYGGNYSCAIWKAFVRRGMGVLASQGSSDVTGDEKVDFTEVSVFITKHVDKKFATPGGNLNYTIGLKAKAVCGSSINNYSVTDSLPGNITYVSSDGTYNPANRTVTFNNINMSGGDSLTYKIKVRVNPNTAFPDSVYINDSVNTLTISDKWVAKNGEHFAWTTLNLGAYYYYSNDASVRDAGRLVTAQEYYIPGNVTTFSFYNRVSSDDFQNGGVVEITADEGATWMDLGSYMSGFVYNGSITGNSELHGRKAFSGVGFGTTVIDLSSFAGKKVKLRFRYATSDSSFAVPNGGTGWIIRNIVLSASASVTNTAKVFDEKEQFQNSSTVVTKIRGGNISNDFIAVNNNNTEALLSWHTPGEPEGTYKIERSVDKGVTFKEIGTVNTRGNQTAIQSYNFTDAAPAEGINFYRIHHMSRNGTIDYTEVKALTFDHGKVIRVYPNPAKDKIQVFVPGNGKAVTLQLTDGSGKVIKSYKAEGQSMVLRLPAIAAGVYYLNVIKADGATSRHKIVVE